MNILVVNIGSTSIKISIIALSINTQNLEGKPNTLVSKKVKLDEDPKKILEDIHCLNYSIDCVAHRIVHGGDYFDSSCILTDENLVQLDAVNDFAPLHNPKALQWVKACQIKFPVKQVGVFDTAFYVGMPAVARHYAIPNKWTEDYQIKRYGFHGIAHYSMWQQWCQLRPDLTKGGKLISIQLGGGCSITAIKDGHPQDTSMGFSPNEGLMMTTRCGDLDSGVVLHLMNIASLSADEMLENLNQKSGLLGVSNKSSDIGDLLEDSNPSAKLAVDLFCYRIQKTVGSYIAVLGGVDGICFGGGISVYQPAIRKKTIEAMQWYGIELDEDKNKHAIATDAKISSENSQVDVRLMQVEEGLHIAKEAFAICNKNKKN